MPENGQRLIPQDQEDLFTPERQQALVRAALSPKESDFFKEFLGQEAPGLMDYLLPQGRFSGARHLREALAGYTMKRVTDRQSIPGDPTVGDQQQLFPGMPVQTSAMKPSRVEHAGPGAPVLRSDEEFNRVNADNPLLPDSARHALNYKEGPRPTSQTGPLVADTAQRLNPAFKDFFNQKVHQAGLRPYAGGSRAGMMEEYESLMDGTTPERFPGHAAGLAAAIGITHKEHRAGSTGDRLAKANALTAESKAQRADELVESQLQARRAGTELSDERTAEIQLLKDAKLRRLEADIKLKASQTDLAGKQSGTEQARVRTHLLNLLKFGVAMNAIDPDEETVMLDAMLAGTGLQAGKEVPSWIQQRLEGLVPGYTAQTGTKITQRPGETSPGEAPGVPGAPAAPATKEVQARALFERMKEGDVELFDGVKYRKTGTQLIPEN